MKIRRAVAGFLLIALGASATLAGVLIYIHQHQATPLIPKAITEQVTFPLYYPVSATDAATGWRVISREVTYDTGTGVATLPVAEVGSTRRIILTEQATPGVFSDVPTQYGKLLTSLNEYHELQTSFGTVALTHPKELNGGQSAVTNPAGTLLFAKPSSALTSTEWQAFFQLFRRTE